MKSVLVTMDKLKEPNNGLGQFSLHLGRALLEIDDPELRLVCLLPHNRRNLFEGYNAAFQDLSPLRKEAIYRWVRHAGRLLRLRGRSYALWHATNQEAGYLPFDERVPVILTIHDLNFLRERGPDEFEGRLRTLQAVVDRAAAVTTISEFSASEIDRHVDLGGKPLHVIYNGVPAVEHPDPYPPAAVPEGRFVLAIGRVAPKKNFHVLPGMMKRLPGLRLVVVGNRKGGYGGEIEKQAAAHGVNDRVVLTGAVTDGERCWLYRNAEALLVPSLTEGFGLPVVEAMSLGKPVFMSNSTSLPEVGGAEGFYWDNYDPDHMAVLFRDGMAAFGADPRYPDRLRANAARFTWKRAAAAYHRLYRSVIWP